MDADLSPFQFTYAPTEVVFGRGCVDSLDVTLDDRGLTRALVVCGTNVGANRAVMDPVETGLGDSLADVFDGTTPDKTMDAALDGVERLHAAEADVVVAVGGGSSMNVARAVCALARVDRPRDAIVEEAARTGVVPAPDATTSPVPLVAIPTTMAGADLTADGGVTLPPDTDSPPFGTRYRRSVRLNDERLMPEAVVYDPALFATTPMEVLSASAMNGFDKSIETVYARTSAPPAVAHALHSLRYLRDGLLGLREAAPDDAAFDRSALGMALVQYGCETNVIHTFGNGVSFHYDVQQGTVHGILAPHVLRYVFDRVDAERRLLADALGLDVDDRTDAALAETVVEEVIDVRDALGLPDRLRDVEGLEQAQLPAVADEVAGSYKHARNPPGIEPTPTEVLEVLQAAW